MEKKVIIVFKIILLAFLFSSCQKEMNITPNENGMKILDLDESGKIREVNYKKKFEIVLYPILQQAMIDQDLGYRISENMEKWRVYEDKGYHIVIGTVAKNENKLYMFTAVYEDNNNNTWEIISLEIGKSRVGKYPNKIIPNTN